ncbi:MAG TPA: ABC transporter substrate-binding protein [Chloroflexota bacterium]|nr:ABC transporter substrate-binding protein [Chloroflexota bacterium]
MNARRYGLALALPVALLLNACGGAAAPPSSAGPATSTSASQGGAASAAASGPTKDTKQSLIDGARKEGALTLVWGEGALGGSQYIPKIADAFNKHYGLHLKVQFTPGPNFQEMGAKVTQEYQTQHPATSDVLNMSDSSMVPLIQAGALFQENWTDWAENIKAESVAPQGQGVTVQTYIAGITYNSKKLTGDAVPKSMQDLLKPQFKGRVASTPYASSFDRLSTPAMWGKQATLDYATKLSSQLGGLIRCPDAESKLLDGEFDVFALDCNQTNAMRAQSKGEPLGFVIPTDAAILSEVYITVPKNAAHPNAAKLWVDFQLSREAQDIIYSADFVDSHLLPGSKTGELVDKYQAQGVKFLLSNVQFFQDNNLQEMRSTLDQIVKILTNKPA